MMQSLWESQRSQGLRREDYSITHDSQRTAWVSSHSEWVQPCGREDAGTEEDTMRSWRPWSRRCAVTPGVASVKWIIKKCSKGSCTIQTHGPTSQRDWFLLSSCDMGECHSVPLDQRKLAGMSSGTTYHSVFHPLGIHHLSGLEASQRALSSDPASR